MFDDLSRSISSTLSNVFGSMHTYERPGAFELEVMAIVRRDVDVFDDLGQVVGRADTVRIAFKDISFKPQRGDTVSKEGVTWTLGKRLADDGYSYVHEATT